MQRHFKSLAALLAFACVSPYQATAQQRINRNEYPFSIMTSEPGERRARPDVKPKRPKAQPLKEAKSKPRRVRRGSSTFSTIPTYRSPLTPLGTAPKLGTAPSYANPASPAAQVPGITTPGGTTAMTPPRPAGQGFQDRAVSCVHSGAASGVSPGQIGAFTQSCVNR